MQWNAKEKLKRYSETHKKGNTIKENSCQNLSNKDKIFAETTSRLKYHKGRKCTY